MFTPNVDHVVSAEDDALFNAAYGRCDLRLADGMPLIWASKLMGQPLPEKVSGSDLFEPLMRRAAERGWRVYLLGGRDGVLERAAQRLRDELGVNVVGAQSPWIRNPTDAHEITPIVNEIAAAKPDLLIVALGAPKQELFIDTAREQLKGTVSIGLGATLDFYAGAVRRAPRWLSDHGFEWAYRLFKEPRRMWRRYLVRDPRFALIVARELRRGPPAMALPG